jgi:hypothetical protein
VRSLRELSAISPPADAWASRRREPAIGRRVGAVVCAGLAVLTLVDAVR